MNFGQAIVSGFKRYVDFNGRSSRSEFWWWALFYFIGSVVFVVVADVAGANSTGYGSAAVLPLRIFGLVMFLPTLALTIRRLHDTNRSGWWYLLYFTIIGAIVLLVWYCMRGTVGENKFGPDPLGAAAPEAAPAAF